MLGGVPQLASGEAVPSMNFGPPQSRLRGVSLPAKTDDPEVAELRRRLVSLPQDRQLRVLEGVLTPGLRLRLVAEQIRQRIGPMDDAQEAEAEREIDEAVREVRRRTLNRGR